MNNVMMLGSSPTLGSDTPFYMAAKATGDRYPQILLATSQGQIHANVHNFIYFRRLSAFSNIVFFKWVDIYGMSTYFEYYMMEKQEAQ